jgi:hypothetical protein
MPADSTLASAFAKVRAHLRGEQNDPS